MVNENTEQTSLLFEHMLMLLHMLNAIFIEWMKSFSTTFVLTGAWRYSFLRSRSTKTSSF